PPVGPSLRQSVVSYQADGCDCPSLGPASGVPRPLAGEPGIPDSRLSGSSPAGSGSETRQSGGSSGVRRGHRSATSLPGPGSWASIHYRNRLKRPGPDVEELPKKNLHGLGQARASRPPVRLLTADAASSESSTI